MAGAPDIAAGVEFRRFRQSPGGCAFSRLPVFRRRNRRAGAGDAARADRRSQPEIARLRPASAGERKRLGKRARLDLDDRFSAAHRLCARLPGIRSLAFRCRAHDRCRRSRPAPADLVLDCPAAEEKEPHGADRAGENAAAGRGRCGHHRDRRSRRRSRGGGLFQPHRFAEVGRCASGVGTAVRCDCYPAGCQIMSPPRRRCHADENRRRRHHRSGQRPPRQGRPLDQRRQDRCGAGGGRCRPDHRRLPAASSWRAPSTSIPTSAAAT